MMALDAILAYLHFTAIILLFSFLTVEIVMMRGALDARSVRLLGRVDIWYFASGIGALVTGLARLVAGAKDADFYLSAWPIYVKIGLFVTIAVISVFPTLTFIHWRRRYDHEPSWQVPAAERARLRRFIMIEVHLAALIPLVAVFMSRGFGH
jgi:putative membrane protein